MKKRTPYDDIENLLRLTLKEEKSAPSPQVWDKITQRLDATPTSQFHNPRIATKHKLLIAAAVIVVALPLLIIVSRQPSDNTTTVTIPTATTPLTSSIEPREEQLSSVCLSDSTSITHCSQSKSIAAAGTNAQPNSQAKRQLIPSAVVVPTTNTHAQRVASMPNTTAPMTAGKESLSQTGNVTTHSVASSEQPLVTQSTPNADTTVIPVRHRLDIYIPNLITPNGDGYNDSFTLVGTDVPSADNIELVIFDSQKRKQYENKQYDGSFNGSGLPNGTYYYRIYFKNLNLYRNGTVIIKR